MNHLNQSPKANHVAKASIATYKKGFDKKAYAILPTLFYASLLIMCFFLLSLTKTQGQVSIVDRPQAVDTKTGFMQLDGLFDVSLGVQSICVYIRNDGNTPITNVTATATFDGASGIQLTDSIESFGTLMPGMAVMGFYTADFSGSHPQKHLLTLHVQGTAFSQWIARNLFVLKSVNVDSTSWLSYLPEGSIKTKILTDHYTGTPATLGMPKDFIWTIDYKIPYPGQFGPIPFNDPWWKVAGAIAGVAGGLTYVAGGIVKYCGNEKEGELVKDIGTGVCGSGAIVAAADSIDVFRRGQQNTLPLPNELTLKEEVLMNVIYAPNAGIGVYNYSALVTWNYKRFTTGNTYTYTETETVYNNIHYTTSRTTQVNNNTFNPNSTVLITATVNGFQGIQNNKGYFVANIFPGNQTKINQMIRSVAMHDDGQHGDVIAGDGLYTAATPAAGLPTNQALGIYIFGFDRNNAPDGIDPLVAAMEIGGILISTPELGGCTINADHFITVASPLQINITTVPPSCNAVSDGSISATVNGGMPPFTYLWSNGQTTSAINNLAHGTYTVSVTSANGQSGVQFVTMNQPNGLQITADIQMPGCTISGTGSITLNISTHTPPLSFIWNDGFTSANRNNLLPGTYIVTVNDALGACGMQSFELPASSQIFSCPSDFTINTLQGKNYAIANYDITIMNGCQNFISYSLQPPSGSALNKGMHTVTCNAVTATGNILTCSFNVFVTDSEAPIALINDATLALTSEGVLTLTPVMLNDSSTDNCGIVSASLNPSILECSNIGLTPVTITIYDANNYYWNVLQSSVIYYNNNHVSIATYLTVGKASIIVCGNGGFVIVDDGRMRKYDADGNLQSTIFTSGASSVVLTGDGGFIVIDDGRVRKYDKDGNLLSTIFTSGTVKVIALGDCGFIVVDDGRVRKYDKDGNLQSTIFTSGTVTVTVVPPCGFIVMDDGRIRKYDADGNLQSTIFTSGASSVVLTSDGGFIVIDDGRVRKYDKDGNLQSTIFTSGTVKVIALGDCGFIVVDDGRVRKYDKDGNLQSTIFTSGTVTVTVVPPCGFIVMDDGRIRKYDADGNLQSTIFTSGASSVVLTSDGGFIVIDDGRVRKYDKDGNLQSTLFTSGTVKVIALGDCGFIVVDEGRVRKYDKDGNLQSTIFTSGTVTVTVVPPCDFIVMDDGRIRKYDAEGNLQTTIFTSGASSVVLTGDGGFIVIDDGRVRKYDKDGNLQSTIFTSGSTQVIPDANGAFKVIDNNRIRAYNLQGNLLSTITTTGYSKLFTNKSNQATSNAIVNLLHPIQVTPTLQNINCSGSKSGKISLSVTGNTTPYTYLWSNGKTSKNIASLAAGIYTVTVTDKNGCTYQNTFEVLQPLPLQVSINKNKIKCGGKNTGKATANVSGGIEPYTYEWNTIPAQTNATATGLAAGTYTVTVTDANGCTKTKSAILSQNPEMVVIIQPLANQSTAVASGGIPPYTYQWNTTPVQTNATATGLNCETTYMVTVTDSKGCKKTATHTYNCNRINNVSDSDIELRVFPNPSSGIVNVAWQGNKSTSYLLSLRDVTGRLLYQSNTDISNETVDMTTYNNGIYYLTLSTDNKTTTTSIILNKN